GVLIMTWSVDINAPVNGRTHKATATIFAPDGAIALRDKVDLDDHKQRAKFSQVAAERLGQDAAEVGKRIEEAWYAELAKRETGQESRQDVMPPAKPPDPLDGTPEEVIAEAREMLLDPKLTDRIAEDIVKIGIAGERDLALTIYLGGTSRRLRKPLSL